MRAEDLQSYISKFGEWLDSHAAPSMQIEHASRVRSWREELAAAERLLEQKPELPIAFLGPSQQGKSSLINAIVGEIVLPVGGAIGACTSVITSVHHHVANSYRAEIDFISVKDWAEELVKIRESAEPDSSDEDTKQDRDEREAIKKSALEKFTAVYRVEPHEKLATILSDVNLGLPDDIVRAMSTGEPIVINEEKALTLRNKVRRYLVGREQHDEAHFWPLIGRVRIYGNFKVLSNGVVLVDLPGLNDPNPAREQVTKKYLEEARHIWLVCNSQTGIDRVFTQILRENGLLFRLFLEGRLDVFSVIATRIDDINLEAVLAQMGSEPDDFDGNYSRVLEFRREEITTHVQTNLLAIAEDIAAKADAGEHRDSFFQRVRSIPVFSISTPAYLHAIGRMSLYQGMKLSSEETHVPKLIDHLHSITLEQSYKKQIEASFRRLRMLHEQASRFFLNKIQIIELDDDQARVEWSEFIRVANLAIGDAQEALNSIKIRFEESLQQRCLGFEDRLADLDAQATRSLNSVFSTWQTINWRTLQAAVKRKGVWFSLSLQREFNFNSDIARAYLDLVPFVWDEFFGVHLSGLVEEVTERIREDLHKTVARLKGAMDMLRHQPAGIRESMETSLRNAADAFKLQSDQVCAALVGQIQRTRQTLSNGMVETASSFMQPAYAQAGKETGGSGIKRRILDIITSHAKRHAPALFINMRQELTEGVTVLRASMKPQLSKIVDYGSAIVGRFQENVVGHQIVTPEQRGNLQTALNHLPQFIV